MFLIRVCYKEQAHETVRFLNEQFDRIKQDSIFTLHPADLQSWDKWLDAKFDLLEDPIFLISMTEGGIITSHNINVEMCAFPAFNYGEEEGIQKEFDSLVHSQKQFVSLLDRKEVLIPTVLTHSRSHKNIKALTFALDREFIFLTQELSLTAYIADTEWLLDFLDEDTQKRLNIE